MTRSPRPMLTIGFLLAVPLLASTAALARPPTKQTAAQAEPPLVGRVRTQAGIIDLTRVTVSEGGAAHDVARGTAAIMADANVARAGRAAQVEAQQQAEHPAR